MWLLTLAKQAMIGLFEDFDINDRCVEIEGAKITITVEDTAGEYICDDCIAE